MEGDIYDVQYEPSAITEMEAKRYKPWDYEMNLNSFKKEEVPEMKIGGGIMTKLSNLASGLGGFLVGLFGKAKDITQPKEVHYHTGISTTTVIIIAVVGLVIILFIMRK